MDYNFDLLDKIKALSDAGKLDLTQYAGQSVAELELPDYQNIHYSVTTSKRTPADAYELACAGRDLGDKGTRLFENSFMLAVAYVNGRLRVIDDGDAAGDAAGHAAGVQDQAAGVADMQGMSDQLQAMLGKLNTFETVTRRLEGKVSNIQQTLNSEVKKAGSAPAKGDDDETQEEGTPIRIAIDMHDDDTVVHDVATILEKVNALQGMLAKCADGISENASGTASCIREIRSCSDSIDSLLSMLDMDADMGGEDIDAGIDDNTGGLSGLGDVTDKPSTAADGDAMPVTVPQDDDAAGRHAAASGGTDAPDVTDAMAADTPDDDDDIRTLLNADDNDDGTFADLLADDDAMPSDGDALPTGAHEADDGDMAHDGVDDVKKDNELYAVPIGSPDGDMQPSDDADSGMDGFGIIDGHLDSMDDIAARFEAQVRESLGFKPGVPSYGAAMRSDAVAVDDGVAQSFDDDYVDLFSDGHADADAPAEMPGSDAVSDDAISDMDMSDFMNDMAGDDGDDAQAVVPDASDAGRDDGDGSGLDASFPDVSDMFDDAGDADAGDGADAADAAVVDDAGATHGNDEDIVVPARTHRRRSSRAKWNA